jgi:hypothetical protein
MVFAISYSLLEEQLFVHQFYACDVIYHKHIFYRVRNLLILKTLLLVSAPPSPLRPRQLPCLPTPRPGFDCRHYMKIFTAGIHLRIIISLIVLNTGYAIETIGVLTSRIFSQKVYEMDSGSLVRFSVCPHV